MGNGTNLIQADRVNVMDRNVTATSKLVDSGGIAVLDYSSQSLSVEQGCQGLGINSANEAEHPDWTRPEPVIG